MKNDCIISRFKPNKEGYAMYYCPIQKKQVGRHHRYVYEQHYGPIPAGMVVRHKCDTPNCVNIKHLELGTQYDNIQDKVKRHRQGVRLNAEQVLEIRSLHHKITVPKIAEKFNVSQTSIENILYGKTWTTLKEKTI